MNAVSPVESLVTDHLDLWTAALKRKSTAGRGSSSKVELYGIKKLRELILELAVRGLLVPQNPNDEPASELLKKIAAEKAKLVKEGKIKKEKSLPPVSEEEKPFESPKGWLWERFGNLAEHNAGKTLDQVRNQGELRDYITTSNLYWGKFDLSGVRQMPIEDTDLDKCQAIHNDLLICEGGEAGRAAVWNHDYPICFQNHIHRARFWQGINPYYAYRLLEKMSYSGEINNYRKGVAISNMSGKALGSIPFPLPPLAEQHRIVAKVDELMALCDQLEQETEASLGAHQTLVETLLSALTSAADHAQFASAWQRIAGHFDTLFTTEESIAQLKQTILQLAVMGKLVPQDPNDEPASELLKKIAAEKAKLVKKGKIKKEKPHPPVAEEEKPFELTTGWEWVKLNDMLPEFQNGASSRGDKGGIPTIVLRLADIKYRRVSLADTRALPINKDDVSKYGLAQGDVLIVRVNGSSDIVGQFIPIEAELQAIYCDHFIRMRINQEWCHTSYLCLVGQTKLIRDRISSLFITTAGQKTVNQGHIGSLLVAIPPLAEQHRIVTKVDELMALCDQLKSRLSDAQTTQLHLANALVERAIG